MSDDMRQMKICVYIIKGIIKNKIDSLFLINHATNGWLFVLERRK